MCQQQAATCLSLAACLGNMQLAFTVVPKLTEWTARHPEQDNLLGEQHHGQHTRMLGFMPANQTYHLLLPSTSLGQQPRHMCALKQSTPLLHPHGQDSCLACDRAHLLDHQRHGLPELLGRWQTALLQRRWPPLAPGRQRSPHWAGSVGGLHQVAGKLGRGFTRLQAGWPAPDPSRLVLVAHCCLGPSCLLPGSH